MSDVTASREFRETLAVGQRAIAESLALAALADTLTSEYCQTPGTAEVSMSASPVTGDPLSIRASVLSQSCHRMIRSAPQLVLNGKYWSGSI